jgi:uncharacterized protein YqjF (DUF2071 family)
VVLNYEIEPELLEPHLPPGVELDFWHDRTYVSLVAFLFRRTRLCGLPIPFHRNFPEVNLRFYVKRMLPEGERRGVVFLREIAPRRMVAYVARRFYGEKYLALPMHSKIESDERFADFARRARFEWRARKEDFAIEAESTALPRYPHPDSLAEFIIEHYWAYSCGRKHDGCIEYEVEHSPWMIRPARAMFKGDAPGLYGRDIGDVLARPPVSAFLANGSAVAVLRGNSIAAREIASSFKEKELAANARG